MMTRNPTPTDEALRAALAGVFRSGVTTFFEITETGDRRKLNVSDRLRQLGMSYGSISTLLKTYPFPDLKYRSPYLIAKEQAKGKANKLKAVEDENEDQEAAASKAGKSRYQYVQSISRHGTKHGIWDGQEGAVVFIAYTLAECQEEMVRLKSGKTFGDWGSYKKCSSQE
jgi:hypothetical protein